MERRQQETFGQKKWMRKDEEEHGPEERKEIWSRTSIMATRALGRPQSPRGLRQRDTFIFKGALEHKENEPWWLVVENRNGQVDTHQWHI